jgi:hypothetical protein
MKRASQQEMEVMVASFKSSGLSQREFCLRENIKLPTFSYWYRKVGTKATPTSSGFTEVTPSLPSSGLEVVYPNGVRIRGIQDLAILQLLVKL